MWEGCGTSTSRAVMATASSVRPCAISASARAISASLIGGPSSVSPAERLWVGLVRVEAEAGEAGLHLRTQRGLQDQLAARRVGEHQAARVQLQLQVAGELRRGLGAVLGIAQD